MKTLSELIDEASDGARNDSAIDDAELSTLKELAKILKDENAEDLETLKDRLRHYCE